MKKRLEWPQLTTDLEILFKLPRCYSKNFNWWKKFLMDKGILKLIDNATKGVIIEKPESWILSFGQNREIERLMELRRPSKHADNPQETISYDRGDKTFNFSDLQRYTSLGLEKKKVTVDELFHEWKINMVSVSEVLYFQDDHNRRGITVKTSDKNPRYYLYHLSYNRDDRMLEPGKYYRLEKKTPRYSDYKMIVTIAPHKSTKNELPKEDYIDKSWRKFSKDKIDKYITINDKKIIQYNNGKTYIFSKNHTTELLHNKKDLVEWWMITDDRMILRYKKWALTRILHLLQANDVFIVIDTEEWKVLWSFEGSFNNEYIEFEGKLLPHFEEQTKIQEIETMENLELSATLFFTEESDRAEIIGQANITISELQIQKDIVLPWFKKIEVPSYIVEKTTELLIKSEQILQEYNTLEDKITARTKLESKEHESIKKLMWIKEQIIELIQSNESHHLSFIAYIKEHIDREGYTELQKEIGNVIM